MKSGLILLGLLALAVLIAGETALSVNVGTAEEVNRSLVLDQDMSFTGSGLTVTANDIVINCQFYKITGSGSGIGISFLNNNNVTVKNCVIENFGTGLDVDNSQVLLNTSLITNSSRGIVTHENSVLNTNRNSIKNNTINLENTNPGITITAINNWWGTNVAAEIASAIVGNAVFQPYLTADPYSDMDKDSRISLMDNCPGSFNPDQGDSDNDGKGDACDNDIFIGPINFDPLTEMIDIPPELSTQNETGYWILQFYDGYENEILRNLTSLPVEFISFLPRNGLLLRSNINKSVFEALPFVRFVGIYQPAYKLSPDLFNKVKIHNLTNSNVTLEVKVFRNINEVKNIINSLGASTDFQYSANDILYNQSLLVNTKETLIPGISQISDVNTINRYFPREPLLDVSTTIIAVRPAANQPNYFGLNGDGEIVGIHDTGVDFGQRGVLWGNLTLDLRGRITFDPATLAEASQGADENPLWPRAAPWAPGGTHGTHVVGTIMGNGSLSGGLGITGVAPNATGYFSSFYSGQSILNYMTAAKLGGAKVHSNSWGWPNTPNNYNPDANLADTFTRANNDILMVIAAGNCGPAGRDGRCITFIPPTILSPGMAKNAITVGASENLNAPGAPAGTNPTFHDNQDDISGLSSQGPAGVRLKPDIVAPGDIISSVVPVWSTYPSDTRTANYSVISGTSMATPHVSGLAALIRQYLRTRMGVTPSGELLKAFVINGAVDMNNSRNTPPVPNNLEGWGRVNLTKSLAPCGKSKCLAFFEDTLSNPGKMEKNYTFLRFSEDRKIEMTLAWYDYPGNALVNDLDLKLLSSRGDLYWGGVPSFTPPLAVGSDGMSHPNIGADRANTVEKIIIPKPSEDGFYNLTIHGETIRIPPGPAVGTQSYGLVLSGFLGVDSANATNITYNFTEGDNIYAQAVGLPNDTQVRVVVVAYNRTFKWNRSILVTDSSGNGLNGFKVLNITNITTTANGTFPDRTIIWNTTGKTKDIIEANGTFNIFINLSNSGTIWFNNRTDVIDYHKKPGFRVAAISSANKTNLSYYFPMGSKIFARAVNLPEDKDVRIVTIAHNDSFEWNTSIQVTDNTGSGAGFKVLNISNARITANGTLPNTTVVWDTMGREKEVFESNGTFNMFINMSGSGYPLWFNNSTDIIDFHKKVGFRVGAISSANSTNLSYYFTAGSKIYAKAVGLPNNTLVQIIVVNHSDMIKWDQDIWINPNFTKFADFTVTTSGNGTLDNIVLWDTLTTPIQNISKADGAFNIILNYNTVGNPLFNFGTDIVDFSYKPGFNVSAVDSSGSAGNLKDNFTIGEKVYGKGMGFREGSVNVSVFSDQAWFNGMSLSNPKKKVSLVIGPDGKFLQELLNKTNITDIGGYDIVVDVNKNEIFDEDIDVVDGKYGSGFYICGVGKICSLLESADSSGNLKNIFFAGDNIYAHFNAISPAGCTNCRIYVVKGVSQVNDLNGHTLVDESSNGFETINLLPNQNVNVTMLIWPVAERPLGDYELIIDDGDGVFDISKDGFDQDGFGITQDLHAPRFAVDSEGNIHIVALLKECCTVTMPGGTVLNNMNITKIIYGKVPRNASFTVDVDHPEYFNWSNALTVTNFTTIYARLTGTSVEAPDIAVDMNNEPHIAFGISSSGFNWITYIKLNKDGKRDPWADATICDPGVGCTPTMTDTVEHNIAGDILIPACRPLSGGTYLCPGNGLDLLTYWWIDFVDVKLLSPRITIINGTVPAILTEVDFTYPDTYYLTQIYPGSFMKYNPIILHPLQPPAYMPEVIAGPAQFNGASLQVAIKNMLPDDKDGGSEWPSGNYSPRAGRRFAEIMNGVSAVMAGVSGSQGRRDGWIYMPIDEYSIGASGLLFFNYNLYGEGNRIHVVYTRPENYDRANYNLDMASRRKLFYQKIDLTGIDLNDSVDDRGVLLNTDPASRKIPIPGSEIKVSDDVVNKEMPDLDVDSGGVAHFVWQTLASGTNEGLIKYATSDHINEKIVGRTRKGAFQARVSIALDSKNNPYIAWVDKVSSGPVPPPNGSIFYANATKVLGVVNFNNPIEIVNSSEYLPETPFFDYSGIMINKNSSNDWADRIYLGWLYFNPHDRQYVINVKRTTPHITMLLVLDGYSADYLMRNLDSMPNLKELLKNNPKMVGTASVPFPGTTFSSQASLFTGLNISNHKIHGDNIAISGVDYMLFDDPGNVNTILQNENVETIYDYLKKINKSKAVLGDMYQKGVGINRPDHLTSIGIDWTNGVITNYDTEIMPYLSDLKNNDQNPSNDVADFITVYILTNDHGLNTQANSPVYRNSLNESDKKIGEIIGKLKSQNIFNDTVFVITGDHGLTDVRTDRSINNSGVNDPAGVLTSELKLNGQVAYYYVPGAATLGSIAPHARVLFNNSFVWNTTGLFGHVEKILVKDPATDKYFRYYFDGINDSYLHSDIRDFASDRSPEIILFSKVGSSNSSRYYFQESHKGMWGMNSSDYSVPFIITGPGFWLFRQSNQTIGAGVKIQDAGVTASYFVGGDRAERIMSGLEGKNAFTPQFRVKVGSPVTLHLYDSQGRHTGPDQFGNPEAQIPSSNYRIIEPTGKKEITLLQAPDRYRVEVEGTGSGRFTLWIEKNTDTESFSIEYPRMMIKEYSLAQVDMVNSNSMDMKIDLDRDGVFETSQSPRESILIYQDVPGQRANASMVHVTEGTQIGVDVSRSTNAIITATALSDISGSSMEVQKISDASLDSSDFYTTGNYIDINFSDGLPAGLDNLNLTINYPDHELLPKGLAEGSLSIYEWQNSAWIKLDSTRDTENNLITATISGSGRYLIAGNDRVPQINFVEALPSKTNVPNTTIRVKANITDNSGIKSAHVEFLGARTAMGYETSPGLYTADLTGPERNGTYEVKVFAEDMNNNTASSSTFIEFDRMPPVITIISPENKLYTANAVELKYIVNEKSNQSYVLDAGAENETANMLPFRIVNIPLTNLSGGNHSVTVHAMDELGNRGEAKAEFGIARQNIKVENLVIEPHYRVGENATISADVINTMMIPESGIEVQVMVDSITLSTQILNLSGLESRKVSFNYTAVAGRKKAGIRSVPLSEELYVADNSVESWILVTDKVPVLFVDEDTSHNNSRMLSALSTSENGKYDYLLWRTTDSGGVTSQLMDRFPLVIWSSNSAGSISAAQKEAVSGYLNNNGYLLVSGDNFGKEMGATEFYAAYIGARYIKDSPVSVLEGIYRDPIGNGLLFEISGNGEEIAPVNGATSSFIYNGGNSAAVRKENGFRTVYFAFDVNDIIDDSTRNSIIERTLKWFNIDSTPPVISNITPHYGEGLAKNTTEVNLTLKTDETAECRISGSNSSFREMALMNSTNSMQHSTLITGLQNDGHYTFYIKCSDTRRNIAAVQTSFFVWNRTFLPPDVEPISDITVLENENVRIIINASDPENDILSYSISDILSLNFPRPFAAKFKKAGNAFEYNTTFDDEGIYNLRVTVSDGFEDVSRTFKLTVIDVNRPPVLSFIGNKSINENTYFYFDVNATDPDGDELRFSDDTPLFDINPYTGIISFTPKSRQVGIYRVNIGVSDGEYVDSETVTFNVTGINHPPVLDFIQPQFGRVGVSFNLTLSAYDADSDILTFSDNTTLFDISSTGQISFTPSITDIGTYNIEIRVSDGKVWDSKIFNLVVTNTNTPPRILNITQNMSVRRGQTVEIGVEACDPDIPWSCP